MKGLKKRTIVCIALIPGILVSCVGKGDQEKLESVCDALRGQYKCISVEFSGPAVDVDNDGNAGLDMIREYSTLSNAAVAINDVVRVEPLQDYDEEGRIYIVTPAQDITYHKDSGDYELRNGGYITIPYSYTVSSDGSVLFNAVSDQLYIEPVEGDNEIYHLDYSFYKAKSIYVGGGEIKAVVDCGIYDFISGMMIKGTVTLSYERFTFAL